MAATELYGSRELRDREERVIRLVHQGYKNREIAVALGTTEMVVKNYLRIIYDKVGMWNRVELAIWYEKRRCESCPLRSAECEPQPVTIP